MKLYLFNERLKKPLECFIQDGHIILNSEKFPLPTKKNQIIRMIHNNKPLSLLCGKRNNTLFISYQGITEEFQLKTEQQIFRENASGGSGETAHLLFSQIPGKVVKVFAKEGDELKPGDPILILEAMKMENEIRAKDAEKVVKIHVKEGDTIEAKSLLVTFKEKT